MTVLSQLLQTPAPIFSDLFLYISENLGDSSFYNYYYNNYYIAVLIEAIFFNFTFPQSLERSIYPSERNAKPLVPSTNSSLITDTTKPLYAMSKTHQTINAAAEGRKDQSIYF